MVRLIILVLLANCMHAQTTWVKLNSDPYTGRGLRFFAMSPEGNLYSASDSVLYTSADEGVCWKSLELPSKPHITALAAGMSGVITIGMGNTIHLSTNSGDSWNRMYTSDSSIVTAIVLSNNRWFAVLDEKRLLRSSDMGATWEEMDTTLSPGRISTIYVDRTGWLLAGSQNPESQGIHLSQDNGATWTNVHDSLRGLTFERIGEALLAGTQSGILRSDDDGLSWRMVSSFVCRQFAMHADGTLYLASYRLWKSADTGRTQQSLDVPIAIYPHILIHPGMNIFATTAGGIFRSADSGVTWTKIHYNTFTVGDVLSISTEDGDVEYFTTGGLLRIINACSQKYPHAVMEFTGITFGGTIDSSLWIGRSSGAVHRSRDNGKTWEPIVVDPSLKSINVITRNYLGHYYAGGSKGMRRSTDDGVTWNDYSGGDFNNAIVYSIVHYGFWGMIAATSTGLYRSENYGRDWREIFTGRPNPAVNSTVVHESLLFACTSQGLYWGEIDSDEWKYRAFPGVEVHTLSIVNDEWFVGCATGLFNSRNLGKTWDQLNSFQNVKAIRVTDDAIYCGSRKDLLRSARSILSAEPVQLHRPDFEFGESYPVPASDQFYAPVTATLPIRLTARITDIKGKMIRRWTVDLQQGYNLLSVQTGEMPAGSYFLSINSGKIDRTRMFMIDR